MATKSDYEIYRRRQDIKFFPTLCKYFTVADFDISCGIHEQYFYTNIGRISSRLGGSREGCMIFYVFVVLHNIIHRNRPISFWFMQTAELEVNLAMFINCYISYKNYRKFHGKLVSISFESWPFLDDNSVKDAILYAEYLSI